MNNDIFTKRLSIRKFKSDDVPQDIVQQLLHAATAAPNAGNCQPWHFYIVRSAAVKGQLSECACQQSFIGTAPVVIVVCSEPLRSAKRYADRGQNLYAIQDTAAAIENILLCASLNGLGACWCGAFDEASVTQVLKLSEDRHPVAIIPIGYPKGLGIKPRRRPMKEVITIIE